MYTHMYIFDKIKFTTTKIVFAWREVRNCLWCHQIHFLLVIRCWPEDMQPVLSNNSFLQWDSLGENQIFICKCLSIEDVFLVREEGMCQLLFLTLGVHLVQTNARPVNAALVFVVHMCTNSTDLKDLVFFSSINSGSYLFARLFLGLLWAL